MPASAPHYPPPLSEALLTPYEEQVAMDQPARFYLFMMDIRFQNNQGKFSEADWQVLVSVSRFFAVEHKKASISAFRQTAKLVQNADINTFAQHTVDMLIKLNEQIDQLKKGLLERTFNQLTGQGNELFLKALAHVASAHDTHEIVHWQRIADEDPQLLYKMYKQVYEQLDQVGDDLK